MWSTSVALISSGTRICPRPRPLFCLPTPPARSLTPLPLLSGCWPRPSPCPSIVRYCNIVLCSGYIYILASWWFTRCTFVRESQDSPVSNLPIQDRFRKKVLWKCIEIRLTYYDNLFNHFACKDLCYELMPKCCGRWDYSTETHYNAFWSTWHKQLIM